MAESRNNPLTHGLSGKFADLMVVRQKNGKTIFANKPSKTTVPPSARQKAVRGRFLKSTVYGKAVMADPILKAAYEAVAEPGQTAYNMAVKDFFSPPEIEEVQVTGYTGVAGDKIVATVTDFFKVKTVRVKIVNSDASLVEEGNATINSNGLDWTYTATVTNSALAGDKIIITATDTPDNSSEKEIVLA